MSKAYWIARVTVTDLESYAGYQALAPEAFAKHGARFLARGGDTDTPEGKRWDRHVVIEFPSLAEARACYASPEYSKARALRAGACDAEVFITEGL